MPCNMVIPIPRRHTKYQNHSQLQINYEFLIHMALVKNGHGLVPLCSVQLCWRCLYSLRTLVAHNMQMCFLFVTSSAGETVYHTQSEKESLQVTVFCKQLCHMSQLVPKFLNFSTISKDILPVFKLWLFPAHCFAFLCVL